MHSRSLNSLVEKHLAIPGFQVYLKPEWASALADSRRSLRSFLQRKLSSTADVLDLDKIPELAENEVSISHCKMMGGFSAAKAGSTIGFDVEVKERVRSSNIHIVCVSAEEKQRAPHAAALWSAKEAAFKFLKGPQQPRGVADIEIGAWIELSPGVFQCEMIGLNGQAAPANRGLVIEFMEADTEMTASFFTKSI